MEFFASFVLDRVGVVLQVIDVLVQAIIFLLELLHLLLEQLSFFALVGEGGEAVMSKDDAVGHDQGEDGGGEGGGAAPPKIHAVFCGAGERGELAGELRFV